MDSREPEDWINQFGADGERYSYPESLNRVGFFEDFFDGKQQLSTFWGIANRNLARAARWRGFLFTYRKKNSEEPVLEFGLTPFGP
uniref:Uncharacterized protein n=1 Tax=Candidatus Kentrum sp. UNK TaxID=2126344 RepID=A0A451AJB1_9GAMM|nr:MAG: hypothetical protein BECKUNK1418G_GA0071005_108013 [Candidatus Kentron sp. UNK]VFK71758.1 MAG: hypothetical protein BECKUNK1418H_GA0071006_108113 [Candidatus Kentron sp. UNK]